MNRKHQYKDMAKYAATKKRWSRKYYGRTQNAENSRQPWTQAEDDLILQHSIIDRQISSKIGRSVRSIQVRRSKLKRINQHVDNTIFVI